VSFSSQIAINWPQELQLLRRQLLWANGNKTWKVRIEECGRYHIMFIRRMDCSSSSFFRRLFCLQHRFFVQRHSVQRVWRSIFNVIENSRLNGASLFSVRQKFDIAWAKFEGWQILALWQNESFRRNKYRNDIIASVTVNALQESATVLNNRLNLIFFLLSSHALLSSSDLKVVLPMLLLRPFSNFNFLFDD
jgi:hypothetical protein